MAGDLRFYALFNIGIKHGFPYINDCQLVCDNKKLYAVEPRLRLERSSPQAGLEPGTARSALPSEMLCIHPYIDRRMRKLFSYIFKQIYTSYT